MAVCAHAHVSVLCGLDSDDTPTPTPTHPHTHTPTHTHSHTHTPLKTRGAEPIYNAFKAGVMRALAQWPELADPQRNMFTGYAVFIPDEVLRVRKGRDWWGMDGWMAIWMDG